MSTTELTLAETDYAAALADYEAAAIAAQSAQKKAEELFALMSLKQRRVVYATARAHPERSNSKIYLSIEAQEAACQRARAAAIGKVEP